MTTTLETLHDDDPGDVHAWQTIATLATALAIAERTVRARVAAGTVERLSGPGGRSYYRVPPQDRVNSAPGGSHGNGGAGSRQAATEESFALVVREHQAHLERLALELGAARATAEQAERLRQAESRAHMAKQAALESELGNVRLLARQIATSAEQRLSEAQASVAHERERSAITEVQLRTERDRAARLQQLAMSPWYALRVRRRLRRELAVFTDSIRQVAE